MPDNEERFLFGGAAYGRRHGGGLFGAAPVSEKRVGLNRYALAAMGIVLAGPLLCLTATARMGRCVKVDDAALTVVGVG